MSAREHVFMLQNCASECVNNRSYRTPQETCDEGAPCSSGQGSEAMIGSLHIQTLPTNRQKSRTCCCTCSCYKILCCTCRLTRISCEKGLVCAHALRSTALRVGGDGTVRYGTAGKHKAMSSTTVPTVSRPTAGYYIVFFVDASRARHTPARAVAQGCQSVGRHLPAPP